MQLRFQSEFLDCIIPIFTFFFFLKRALLFASPGSSIYHSARQHALLVCTVPHNVFTALSALAHARLVDRILLQIYRSFVAF